jgi:hypothetical protein
MRIAALPGDEDPATSEEGQPDLDQLGKRSDRACRDRGPGLAIDPVRGQCLSPFRHGRDTLLQTRRGHDRRKESDLLRDRVDEQRPIGRDGRCEGQAGEPPAAAQVDEPIDAALGQDGEPGQAVGDMADRDGCRVADRRQVDRRVPGEQQPDVVVDRPAGGR